MLRFSLNNRLSFYPSKSPLNLGRLFRGMTYNYITSSEFPNIITCDYKRCRDPNTDFNGMGFLQARLWNELIG